MGKRDAILLLILELLLAPGLMAQGPLTFTVKNTDTVAMIINAQVAACRAAENATSDAELDALDLPLQQMIQNVEQRVRRAQRDSMPGFAAWKADSVAKANLEARLEPLETRLGVLQAARNVVTKDSLQPRLDRITATLEGDNPARRSLDAVNDSINSLRVEIARLENALKEFLKENPNPGMLEGRHESLGNRIRDKQAELARLEAHQLTILRATLPLRGGDPRFAQLQNQKTKLDDDIQELEADIRTLREAREATKERLAQFDIEGIKNLEQLHEENGFTEQYIHQARDCIQKRRTQLASGAGQPPPVTPPATSGGLGTAYIVGTWTANCSGDLPPEAARTDGGAMNFYFDATKTPLDVRVDFLTTGKVGGIDYGAGGHVLDDGTIADGRGGAPGLSHTLVWDGRLVPDMARSTPGLLVPDKWMGSGNVTVTDILKAGGGTCTGTWTAATP